MTTPRRIAEAFSRHHFRETYEALAPDVRWISVGAGELTGRDAVIGACEAALNELSAGSAEFSRFVVIAEGDAVAVDAVARYADAAGAVSVVSSSDFYAFADGRLTSITSYAVELESSSS